MAASSSRIAAHIQSAFRNAAAGLTGNEFTVALAEQPETTALAEPIVWQQTLSVADAPSLWIAAGKDLWESLARIVLEAAGVDLITDEDSRSTWQEVIGQTVGGLASALTADLLREVTSSQGEVIAAEPGGLEWTWFSVRTGGEGDPQGPWSFRAAWSPALSTVYEAKPAEVRPQVAPEAVSRTFDLLLDVALPVSVSFGKTSLQIREVLKLNTGSIVELNRFVNDPVDVIVNDCVIARGEVVVVDGNYGVRISQLATREDRLRTGMGETPRQGVRA
jgi:flagellar motor switch protein FliN/FliY